MKLLSSKIHVPFIILCFLIISMLIIPGIILKNSHLGELLTDKVEREISLAFGGKVEIGKIGFHGLSPELFEVKIDSPDGQPVLEAEKIRISLDLLALVFSRGSILSSLRRMDFTAPTVRMTLGEDGKPALPNINAKEESSFGKQKLQMILGIDNGKFLVPVSEEKWPWGNYYEIYGEVDLRTFPGIAGSLKFKSSIDSEAKGEITIRSVNGWEGSLEIMAEDGSAPLWGDRIFSYFGISDRFQIKEGKTTSNLYFSWGNWGEKKFKFDSAKVRLNDAEIKWDKLAGPIKQVNTEVDFDPNGLDIHRFRGFYNKSLLDIKGRLINGAATEPARTDLKLYARELNVTEWTNLLPSLKSLNATGLVDLNLVVQGRISKPAIEGEILLKEGGFTIPEEPFSIDRLRMLAKISGEEVELTYAEGRLNNSLFFMKGTFTGWNNPRLNMEFNIRDFKTDRLLSRLNQSHLLTGPVSGSVKISGELASPVIKGEIHSDSFRWRNISGEKINLVGEYNWGRDILKIEALTLRTFEGDAGIKGLIGSLRKELIFDLDSKFNKINMASIPFQEVLNGELPPITGYGNIRLSLKGPLSSPTAVCDLNIVGGSVNQIDLDSIDAKIIWNGDRATARLAWKKENGTLIGDLWWEPPTNDYSAEFLLRNMEIDPKWLALEMPPVQGRISGSLNVRKNQEGPVGEGWLEVHALKYMNKEVGDLKLRGTIDPQGIKLKDSTLLINSNQLEVTGELSWQADPFYDIRISGPHIMAKEITSIVWPTNNPVDVEGMTALEMSISGWNEPVVNGELSMDDLSLYGFSLDRVEAGFTWKNQVLNLENFHLFQGDGKITINGKVNEDEMDLSVISDGIPLESIKRDNQNIIVLAGEKISGEVNLEGRIRGEVKAPVFEGKVEVEELNLAGLNLHSITGELKWNNSILSVEEMRVSRGSQQLKAYGQVDFNGTFNKKSGKEPSLDLGFKMEKTKISDLLLVLGVSPKATIDGNVDGYFRVLGTLKQPLVRVMSQFDEGRVNGYSDLSGELDLQIKDKTVTVNRLRIDDREGEFSASGMYTPGKYVQTSVRMSNFPLETIVALTNYNRPLKGRVDLQVELDTTQQGMEGEFSGGVFQASFGQTKIPPLNLTGQLNDDLLSVNYQETEANKVKLWGNIPLNPQWFMFIPLDLPSSWPHRNKEWDLRLVAANLEASFFNLFFPEGYIKSGTINSDLSLRGKWNEFYLQGSLKTDGVRTALPGLPKEFHDVKGEFDFSKEYLRITGLKGQYGEGRFQTEGGIVLNGLKPVEFQIKLKGDKLHYKNPLFDGMIKGQVQLTGPFETPLLSGDVSVKKTRISIASMKPGAPSEMNLQFDLNIKAEDEVYFRQYGLANIPISGRVHLGGTLKKPELVGEFTADRGSVTVYGDTFRIRTAKAEFKPEYLTLPYLDLEASLYLSGTEIILSTQGWTGDNIALNLTSNPVMAREEIFALLNWTEGFQDSNMGTIVQGNINTVTDTIFGPFIDEFRDLMNIDYFSLERDRDLGNFKMNLGKSLDDDFYLSYSRSLTDLTDEVWTLEWQISPAFSLVGDYSSNEGYEWQLLYRLMF